MRKHQKMKPQKIDFSILDQFSSLLSTISDQNNKIFLTLDHLKKFQTLKLQLEKITYVGMIYKENFHLEFFTKFYQEFLLKNSFFYCSGDSNKQGFIEFQKVDRKIRNFLVCFIFLTFFFWRMKNYFF